MSITYTIPGAGLLDQLHEPTLDGHVDENARDNCVAASIAEGLHILTGKTYDGDELKDAVYGQGYVGFQSAERYIAYCRDQGVELAVVSGSQTGLIAALHASVSAGHPALVTMPSQWGTAPANPVHPSGSTHVGLAVGEGPGMLRIMNPWHGFLQDASDQWWQARLCEGQVWPMVKIGVNQAMWTNAGGGNARDSRGVVAHYAMATYLLAHPALGDVVKGFNGETYYDATRSFLPLEGDTVLQWDKARGSVIEAGGEVAVDLWNAAKAAQSHVDTLQVQVALLQAQLAEAHKTPALTTQQQAALSALATFKAALADV